MAAHHDHRHHAATQAAADLWSSRLFTRDTDPDHTSKASWFIFSYPYWWTDLLLALDTLVVLHFRHDNAQIATGLRWFLDNQQPSGLCNSGRNRPKGPFSGHRVAFAICRMLTRYWGN